MSIRLMLACSLPLLAFGCRKETDATKPPSASALDTGQSSATNYEGRVGTSQSAAVTRESSQSTSPLPVAAGSSELSATLSALTQAVRKYSAEKQRLPLSLDEVLAAGYVKNMPNAPPGKKFVFNPKRVEVILIDQ